MAATEERADVGVHVEVDGDEAGLELSATLFGPDGKEVVTHRLGAVRDKSV